MDDQPVENINVDLDGDDDAECTTLHSEPRHHGLHVAPMTFTMMDLCGPISTLSGEDSSWLSNTRIGNFLLANTPSTLGAEIGLLATATGLMGAPVMVIDDTNPPTYLLLFLGTHVFSFSFNVSYFGR